MDTQSRCGVVTENLSCDIEVIVQSSQAVQTLR